MLMIFRTIYKPYISNFYHIKGCRYRMLGSFLFKIMIELCYIAYCGFKFLILKIKFIISAFLKCLRKTTLRLIFNWLVTYDWQVLKSQPWSFMAQLYEANNSILQVSIFNECEHRNYSSCTRLKHFINSIHYVEKIIYITRSFQEIALYRR